MPVPPAPPRVDDVVALIEQGCFRCLERAYDEAQARGLQPQAFEAAALLVLRSKELGLPFEEWRVKARAAAPEGEAHALYLTMADAIAPDRFSEERYTLFELGVRNARASVPAWRERLRTGPASELFRGYLDLSLVCTFGRVGENADSFTGELDAVAAGAPLSVRRSASATPARRPRLTALRTAHPDFVDADYALGRYLIEDPTSGEQEGGLRRLQSAAAAFPRSPAIAVWIGNTHRGWEEWPAALEAYEAALALSRRIIPTRSSAARWRCRSSGARRTRFRPRRA